MVGLVLWAALGTAHGGAHTARTVRIELPATETMPALPLRVSWPDGVQGAPVIVFSHGMGGSRDAYEALVRPWVEDGYVVVQPTHGDSVASKAREDLKQYDSLEDFVKDPANTRTWRERPGQVSEVIDQLDAIVAAVDGLEPEALDRDHIGVGGHSFGAHTAMLVGGATLQVPGLQALSLKDERIDALLLISPQGTGSALKSSSYGHITSPTLMITGSQDTSARTGRGADWRLEAWEGLPADHAWLLFIEGAQHSMGGIGGRPGAAKNADHLGWVTQTTGRFWDAQLKGDAEDAAWLDGNGIAAAAGDRARLERKAAK